MTVTTSLQRLRFRSACARQPAVVRIRLAIDTSAYKYRLTDFNASQDAAKLLDANVVNGGTTINVTTRCRHRRLANQQLLAFLLNVAVEQIRSKNVRIWIITAAHHIAIITSRLFSYSLLINYSLTPY